MFKTKKNISLDFINSFYLYRKRSQHAEKYVLSKKKEGDGNNYHEQR